MKEKGTSAEQINLLHARVGTYIKFKLVPEPFGAQPIGKQLNYT